VKGEPDIIMVTASDLFRAFLSAGKELYLVGGYVRDALLGMVSRDLDFATSALPEETIGILEANGLRVIPVGLEFGTVATHMEHLGEVVQVEITTYRCSESYTKGSRHPLVAFGTNLEEDLIRRDFTINAMAMDSDGGVTDPFGGRNDIRDRIIRTPLDPGITFREDPLRMLRAVRFMCRFGFSLADKVGQALKSERESILEISRERWKTEMDCMLTTESGEAVTGALEVLRDTGLLLEMIPEFGPMFDLEEGPHGRAHEKDVWGHTLDVVSRLQPRHSLRWAGLLHDFGKPGARIIGEDGEPHFYGHEERGAVLAGETADRFRFSRKERSRLVFLVRNHMRPVLYTPDWNDSAICRLVDNSGPHLQDLLDLAEADISSHTPEYSEKGLRSLQELRDRISSLEPGSVVIRVLPRELGTLLSRRLGVDEPGGRRIGLLLSRLEELVHDGALPAMADSSVYLRFLQEHDLIEE
jgi:poly(A) polymerase